VHERTGIVVFTDTHRNAVYAIDSRGKRLSD